MIPTILLAVAMLASGQAPSPGLQPRPSTDLGEQSVKVVKEGAGPVLPEDAYGLYRFSDHEGGFGEGLQINEQFDEITGYLTLPDPKGGKGRFSSYFLSQVSGGNGHFAFVTRQVHGVSYTFDGQLKRGSGLSRGQDAFYLLDGTLIAHDQAGNSTQSRNINLKLTAQRQAIP